MAAVEERLIEVVTQATLNLVLGFVTIICGKPLIKRGNRLDVDIYSASQ